jgi:dATP pyrophosphohydrolase
MAPPDRLTVRVVDVYPYRRTGESEFLLLRRAAGVPYAGQWRMVGGKIEDGETAWQAALRELREETGRRPVRAWTVPSVNAFYEWQTDRLNLIPAFAAELDGSPAAGGADPTLDAEHDAFVWLPAEAAAARLRWPEQRRLLRLIDALLRDALPPELTLPLDP